LASWIGDEVDTQNLMFIRVQHPALFGKSLPPSGAPVRARAGEAMGGDAAEDDNEWGMLRTAQTCACRFSETCEVIWNENVE
jgi:hypothetical protein